MYTKYKLKKISGCTPENIPNEVFASNTPVLIKNLIKSWPAVIASKKSPGESLEYLKKFATDEPYTVFFGEPDINGRIFYNDDCSGFNFQVLGSSLNQLSSVLNRHIGNDDAPMIYVGSTMIDKWLPEFRAENDIVFDEYEPLVSIWMGNKSRIPAHYDFASNIACCVAGKRRFTLFPPEELENLYVGPLDFTPAGQPISMVDFLNPDFEKFPKFRKALKSALVVELEPGDALMIPSMWWHHVEALEDFNILVNYWWRNSPAFMGSPQDVLEHAIMSIRDLPDEQRKIWKNLFDHYVFSPKNENFDHIPENVKGMLGDISKDIADDRMQRLSRKIKDI
jgi:hypothetical protein